MISFNEALALSLQHTGILDKESIPLFQAVDRIAGYDLVGLVDSPSVDASLKDGYAVHSNDIAKASVDSPVNLRIVGSVAAGGAWAGSVAPGEALRILSGAPIPDGADAVIAEEFTQLLHRTLVVFNDAHPGRNILSRGSDVRKGVTLATEGDRLTPLKIGLIAAAGYAAIPVIRKPPVAILATGDEVVAPGNPLGKGKLYASNLVTLASWCSRYKMPVETLVVEDSPDLIREKLQYCLCNYEVVITSGGAWSGDRDMVIGVLDELGWQKIYHRVRMGPGKAVAFGLYDGKPVFCLPGGPPSNHMAFIQLVLPCLKKLCGLGSAGLPLIKVKLTETVMGQADWTQFIHGKLVIIDKHPLFVSLKQKSRLQMMSGTDIIVTIPEGQTQLPEGQIVSGQDLR
ncbi:MAG: molybdopterin molybdotransferase MoeA [Anaerolineaceae bacterium]|nr:molybdopterin molybdotransferase MoeA [Anaerolineaceae bacterium]